ncbi:hypothetical protein N9I04_03710 [Alphaproteobacteria bacterium]|nr:hypothetical protein [Alphaproteobacteria bacterium]
MLSEHPPNKAAKRYLIICSLPLALLFFLVIVSAAFLWRSGELRSLQSIVVIQQERTSLYGTAIYSDDHPYKRLLLFSRPADVVVLGSSRALPAVQEMFRLPFTNLGRMANSTRHLEIAVNDILTASVPKVVVLMLDFWWVNTKTFEAVSPNDIFSPQRLSPEALLAPLKWLVDGRLTLKQVVETLMEDEITFYGDTPVLGIRGLTRGTGFASDGSRSDQDVVYNRIPARDMGFAFSLSEALADWDGESIDLERLDRISKSIKRLEEAGSIVITVMPPVAPTVFKAMRADPERFASIWGFQEHMSKLSRLHFDFLDPTLIDADDCEFLDGYHGGQLVFARMLLTIARLEPVMSSAMDIDLLRAMIDCCAGRANALDMYRDPTEREVDFLGLGCQKTGELPEGILK